MESSRKAEGRAADWPLIKVGRPIVVVRTRSSRGIRNRQRRTEIANLDEAFDDKGGVSNSGNDDDDDDKPQRGRDVLVAIWGYG